MQPNKFYQQPEKENEFEKKKNQNQGQKSPQNSSPHQEDFSKGKIQIPIEIYQEFDLEIIKDLEGAIHDLLQQGHTTQQIIDFIITSHDSNAYSVYEDSQYEFEDDQSYSVIDEDELRRLQDDFDYVDEYSRVFDTVKIDDDKDGRISNLKQYFKAFLEADLQEEFKNEKNSDQILSEMEQDFIQFNVVNDNIFETLNLSDEEEKNIMTHIQYFIQDIIQKDNETEKRNQKEEAKQYQGQDDDFPSISVAQTYSQIDNIQMLENLQQAQESQNWNQVNFTFPPVKNHQVIERESQNQPKNSGSSNNSSSKPKDTKTWDHNLNRFKVLGHEGSEYAVENLSIKFPELPIQTLKFIFSNLSTEDYCYQFLEKHYSNFKVEKIAAPKSNSCVPQSVMKISQQDHELRVDNRFSTYDFQQYRDEINFLKSKIFIHQKAKRPDQANSDGKRLRELMQNCQMYLLNHLRQTKNYQYIDLHGFFEEEIFEILSQQIQYLRYCAHYGNLKGAKILKNQIVYQIITGKGTHSVGGKAILFPAVARFLQAAQIEYQVVDSGSYEIYIELKRQH